MEELCPDVTFLQYVNPMAMNCWAIDRATSIKTVGLCHSVQGTARQLARDIDVPIDEINYVCAGINHMAFYLTFERDGVDLYPAIQKVLEEGSGAGRNRVRYEMFKRLGYFVTESSEHFAEYVPWFIKRDRPDLIEKFNIPLDEYITRCERQIAELGVHASQAGKAQTLDLTDELRRSCSRHRSCPEEEWPRGSRSLQEYQQSQASATNMAQASSIASRPASHASSMATCPTTASSTTCPRVAASRFHAWSTRTACSPPDRAAAAPPGRADADQHQRAGAHRRGRADTANESTSITPPCSIHTPLPNWIWIRSGIWSMT